jgi:chitinase
MAQCRIDLLLLMAVLAIAALEAKHDNDKVLVCYYGSWAVYRPGAGKFDVEDIDPYMCTHVIYSFAGLNAGSSVMESLDPFNDLYDNNGKGKGTIKYAVFSRST